jgi:hypothetical protein
VGKLPQDLLEMFYWLKTFRDFDFRAGSPADWIKIAPLDDYNEIYGFREPAALGPASNTPPAGEKYMPSWAYSVPDVTDFKSLVTYFYNRFDFAILGAALPRLGLGSVPGIVTTETQSPNKPTGAAGGARGKDAADKDPKTSAIEGKPAGPTSQQAAGQSSSLAGRFSPLEQRIMNVIQAAGHRMTTQEIVHELDRNEGSVSVGTVKNYLAGFTRRGILTNLQDTLPPGYGLADWERGHE